MTIHRTILAATFALAFTGAAHAGDFPPLEAKSIDLGAVSGIAYYIVERDGFRVVAILAQGETAVPWIRTLPKGDVNQLSMLWINPATAYLILTEFVQLNKGDWVLMNAANSAVGRAVIAIAKARGIRTLNAVRRADVVDEVKALGGDVVLVDGPDLPRRVAAATSKASITLALDGVGDAATQNLLTSIERSGTLIVWSAMSGKSFSASGPRLLFFDQAIRGFWIYNWFRNPSQQRIVAMYKELAPLVASGGLSFPVASEFTFDQHQEAIAVAGKCSDKAILKPSQQD